MTSTTQKSITILLETTSRLMDILDGETEHLRRQDVAAIVPLQEDKNKLLRIDETHINTLLHDSSGLSNIDQEQRQLLKNTIDRFHQSADKNRRALQSARDSRRFVLGAIRAAVMESQESHNAYTAGGATKAVFYSRPMAASVAMDQRL